MRNNNSIVTPGRLTIMMPIIQPKAEAQLASLMNEGRQLVHNILVRKGNALIMDKSGTKLKPVARMIFNSNMQRLASNEPPENIVRDLESQLLLIKGN